MPYTMKQSKTEPILTAQGHTLGCLVN